MNCFTIERDPDGIALVCFDVPGRPMNTITSQVMEELGSLVEQIAGDETIRGAVLFSGKDNGFCAGADVASQAQRFSIAAGEEQLRSDFDRAFRFNALSRRLETCGKPIAIAMEGLALGGGLEIALACHHRVVARNPKMQLGFPEATIGLLPGGGGTQRSIRLLGIAKALPLLLEGSSLDADKALEIGIVNEVVEPGHALAAAREWARTGDPVQPWDKEGFKIPGGGPYGTGGPPLIVASANVLKKYRGNYPAQENILRAVYEGSQVPIDAALRIETRFFLLTRRSPQASAMLRTQFQSIRALRKGALRPAGIAHTRVNKGAVIGAGMMGAGIAYVQALAGIETILLDVNQDAAEKGKANCSKLVEKAVAAGRINQAQGADLLARITPSGDYEQARGSDVIIEAVFEDRTLKSEVTRAAEPLLGETGFFGSNTSTLPITGLAEATTRPDAFIGIHFFSPVDRMDLVEVIAGRKSSPETVARALDYAAQIRKTPIVVNDSRGFYTSRCFGTYWSEGIELLIEGVAPAIIDNVGRQTGMPRGPLELVDDVALDLVYKVRKQAKADLGAAFVNEGRDIILPIMVDQHGRLGRKNGKGFYDYPADKGLKSLWAGLAAVAPVRFACSTPELVAEVRKRLLYRQALEAARCLAENVLTDPRSGDVGAVLGWGFAKWTGGPLSLIDQIGVRRFVAECDVLADKCGARFSPPQMLRDFADEDRTIYEPARVDRAA